MTIVVDVTNLGEAAIDSAATTIPFTTGTAVAANGFIVVTVTWIGAAITLSSVGGGGLSWNVDVQDVGDVNDHVAIASAQAPAGLASDTTLTATFSGTGATAARSICGTSFTGVLASAAVDVTGTIVDVTAANVAWTSGNLAVAAGSLTIAVAFGITSDYTSTVTSPSLEAHDIGAGAGTIRNTTCYRIDSGGGSVAVAGTWATAQKGPTIAMAYKAATGAPPQTLRPDADTDADSWTTTPLWSKIDEASAGGDVITATAS